MVKKTIFWLFAILFMSSACSPATDLPELEVAQPDSVLTAVTLEPTATTMSESTVTEESVPTPTEDSMPDLPDDAMTFNLGESFALGGGKTAVLSSGDLTLYFAELLEDSRCPNDVDCFWEGQARILIIAEQSGQAPVELEFNTNLSTEGAADTLPAYEFVVQLEQLNPYPESSENAIAFEAYQAQLLVRMP